MWVSRDKLSDELTKKFEDGLRKGRTDAKAELLPFPDAYQQRLDYWKERAKGELKPRPHVLRLWLQGGCRDEKFDDLGAAKDRRDDLRGRLETSTCDAILFDDTKIMKSVIHNLASIDAGHTSAYTEEGILAWAKEKVEAEMKGWKVEVPEEKTYYSFGPILCNATGDFWLTGTQQRSD